MNKEDDYEKRMHEAEEELQPLLTDEFLETLTKAVQTCGWSVDYTEAMDFVNWCHELSGRDAPNAQAYNYEKPNWKNDVST